MPTFHLNNLPKEKRIQMIGEFYDVIDSLKNRAEVRLFFKSLLTADEIASLMRRVEIAVLLYGGFTYNEIIDILGVGRDKISSVYKSLLQDDSGYKIVIERLIENRKKRLKKIKEENKGGLSDFKKFEKKYLKHYIFSDLLDFTVNKLEYDKQLDKEAFLYTPSLNDFQEKKKKINKKNIKRKN